MAAIKGPVKKHCVTCLQPFDAGSGSAKFCSDLCHINWNIEIKDDGCWHWIGGRDKDGYAVARFSGNRRRKVHRIVHEIFIGPIPKGMLVCHSCDVPRCVKPDHLFVGTELQNKSDSVAKGRHVHGTGVYWKAKLCETEVMAILDDPRHRATVANAYGVTAETIDAIRKRKIWKHLATQGQM